MAARLKRFEMSANEIAAAMRVCEKMLEAPRRKVASGVVARLRLPCTLRAAPQAWAGPGAALAA